MTHIAELRQSRTNVQKLQEYVLMKNKYVSCCGCRWRLLCAVTCAGACFQLMQFLSDHAPPLASEVKQTYVDMMGRVLKVCGNSLVGILLCVLFASVLSVFL